MKNTIALIDHIALYNILLSGIEINKLMPLLTTFTSICCNIYPKHTTVVYLADRSVAF